MVCKRDENKIGCTCTATTCGNRGICCDCVRHHRENGEIPGCFFTPAGERTWDRSIENFVRIMANKYNISL